MESQERRVTLVPDPWPRRPAVSTLSNREVQALVGVARGCSDKDLAFTLRITEGQAAYAVRSAVSKLGVVTRAHAVVRAIAGGYIRVCPERGEAYPLAPDTTSQGSSQESAKEPMRRAARYPAKQPALDHRS